MVPVAIAILAAVIKPYGDRAGERRVSAQFDQRGIKRDRCTCHGKGLATLKGHGLMRCHIAVRMLPNAYPKL